MGDCTGNSWGAGESLGFGWCLGSVFPNEGKWVSISANWC